MGQRLGQSELSLVDLLDGESSTANIALLPPEFQNLESCSGTGQSGLGVVIIVRSFFVVYKNVFAVETDNPGPGPGSD